MTEASEIFYLDVQEPTGPPVSVLLYYSVLAYPSREESRKRKAFLEALVAMRFKEFAVQIGSRKGIPPQFGRLKREKMLCRINLGAKRLERRISAGVMGWAICLNEKSYPYEAATADGKIGIVLRGPNTVSEAVRAYVADRQRGPDAVYLEDDSAAANTAHRVWAESLPVLHIAMANPITVKIVEAQVNTKPPTRLETANDLFDSLHETQWLRKALEDSEDLKLGLRQRLGIDPDDQRDYGFKPGEAISLIPTEDLTKAYRMPK